MGKRTTTPKSPPKEEIFEVAFPPKVPIPCISNAPAPPTGHQRPAPLIFTHGAGGTHTAPAMQHFAAGFAPTYPIIRFQGPMNLASRTAMFGAVLAQDDASTRGNVLGGRSMGARAAVMAATKATSHLVLASYPLVGANGAVRDEILLGIAPDVKVLFVSGERDNMCDLGQLRKVRMRMKATTWMITVKGADHGMNVTPKKATEAIGVFVGGIVAQWVRESDEGSTEGVVSWDAEKEEAEWSGWKIGEGNAKVASRAKQKTQEKEKDKGGSKKRKADEGVLAEAEASASGLKKSSRKKTKK